MIQSPYQKLKEELINSFKEKYDLDENSSLSEIEHMRKIENFISKALDSIAHSVAEAGKVEYKKIPKDAFPPERVSARNFNAAIEQSQKQLDEYFGEKI